MTDSIEHRHTHANTHKEITHGDHKCLGLLLGCLVYSIDLCICFCVSTMLDYCILLYTTKLLIIVALECRLHQGAWFFQLCSFFLKIFWLFQIFFVCYSSVKNAFCILIGIALNLLLLVTQLCLTLCDPTDYSPPGSSVHGILWARILEWAVIL